MPITIVDESPRRETAEVIFRVTDDDSLQDVLAVRYRGALWVFRFDGNDPGLDVLARADGTTVPAYHPFGDTPEGVPEELWVQVTAYLEQEPW